MNSLAGLIVLLFAATLAAGAEPLWLTLEGGVGPGAGKHIVWVSGDEEYRSEESFPMLAGVLARRHGFRCTVLFAINRRSGEIDPNTVDNIPGLETLATADLMVVCTRFRELPDEQMSHIDAYLEAGKPVVGIRPAVVAFRNPKGSRYFKYSSDNAEPEFAGGFGQQVLGSTWISHHGAHGVESTRGLPVEGKKSHPILRGVGTMWGPTDVLYRPLAYPGRRRGARDGAGAAGDAAHGPSGRQAANASGLDERIPDRPRSSASVHDHHGGEPGFSGGQSSSFSRERLLVGGGPGRSHSRDEQRGLGGDV